MVKISPILPFYPRDPVQFTTKPYDVIEKEEELELKKTPNSLVHIILPDGEGDAVYNSARQKYLEAQQNGLIFRENTLSIYVYRQESPSFSHQGFVLGVCLEDYEAGNVVKHEHTREKPLKDRTKHILATKAAFGLVWTVFKADRELKKIMEQIKKQPPILNFTKYGYKQLVWRESDPNVIQKVQSLLKNQKIYIADGHHRAASAAEFRKYQIASGNDSQKDAPWQYVLCYLASDDQVRILGYHRVIISLPFTEDELLEKVKDIYTVKRMKHAFNPKKKHELAVCLKGIWYKWTVKQKQFANPKESLDVAILQDKVLDPILGIKDPRTDKNIFFVGDVQTPKEMEKIVTQNGNAIFINVYPITMKEIEVIAESGMVMPPKSTWFDPKLLSGMILHVLE